MTMLTDRIHHGSGHGYWRAASSRSLGQVIGTALERAATKLFVWLERARQRRELLSLNDRQLHDFGASRCDAAGEGGKPFWRG